MKKYEFTEKELVILDHVLSIVESNIISSYEAFFMDKPKTDKVYKKLQKRIKDVAKLSEYSVYDEE